MTITTHLYCHVVSHDARPITRVPHLNTCDTNPLHTVNESKCDLKYDASVI